MCTTAKLCEGMHLHGPVAYAYESAYQNSHRPCSVCVQQDSDALLTSPVEQMACKHAYFESRCPCVEADQRHQSYHAWFDPKRGAAPILQAVAECSAIHLIIIRSTMRQCGTLCLLNVWQQIAPGAKASMLESAIMSVVRQRAR